MHKRWIIREKGSSSEVKKLSEELNIDESIANLLVQREILDFESAKKFFRPSLDDMHDPFLMKGMKDAVNRIKEAIRKEEKILVYGDYDVDGTTAVSLVYAYLSKFTEAISYYIPDRYKEGYGVSYQGIDFAVDNDFSLIIALDCGVKAVEKIAYAKEKGVDFIVCDHHKPGDQLPDGIVLNPKQKDCDYPYKELSGCGVGFKLIQALAEGKEDVIEFLDLVAVSIAADIVPITGENRVLAYFGLKKINSNPRKGIQELLDLAERKGEITVTDLVFVVGPRINAAGRIDRGSKAVDFLIADDMETIKEIGKSINVNNSDRRELDKSITQEALEMIAQDNWYASAKTTVLFKEDWHKGVIGIVASRVIEHHYKPTIILTESNGKATGSARSIAGFDVYEALEKCADLMEQFGGHKYAAGMTMDIKMVPEFRKRFDKVVSELISDEQLIPEIKIDTELSFGEIKENAKDVFPKFYRIIKQFAPFGPGNMKPTFVSRNVLDSGNGKIVGDDHLKLTLVQEPEDKIQLSGIGFNLGGHYENVLSKKPFDIVYNIEENEWNGNVTLQANIKDIQFPS